MEIILRKEAREKGLLTYFTGQACHKGHVAERRVASGSCNECINDKSEIHIFDTEIEAALHYNYLAEKYFKDFAKLNVVCREPNEVYDIEETFKRLGVDYE